MEVKKISRRSWRVLLNRQTQIVSRENPDFRIAVLGVGNELNGDDGVGLAAARALKKYISEDDRVLVLVTGPAPENFTSLVSRFYPDWVLVVDAARLEVAPGGIAWIELEEVREAGATTHGLPLSMLGRYLVAETGCRFSILGIQVAQTGFDRPMSPPVQRAALRVARALSQILRK
jgi:hydrogenase 3 maturation protease